MWFNNVLIYHYQLTEKTDFELQLGEDILKPCPAHARFIYGWLPSFANELIHEIAGASLICLGKEERILPKGVINYHLAERIQRIEAEQGRVIKRVEKAQIAEDLEFELLPKSFCIRKQLFALLDSTCQRLLINTSSVTRASQLTSLLRKSLPIHLEPLACNENLGLRFAHWLKNPNLLPPNFQFAADCLLFSMDNEKKRINIKGFEQSAEEIAPLLSQGLAAAEIALIWNERVQFTLTHDFTLKRVKCLDYLIDDFTEIKQLEEDDQQRDACLSLLAGELRALLNDLLASLEQTPISSPSSHEELA